MRPHLYFLDLRFNEVLSNIKLKTDKIIFQIEDYRKTYSHFSFARSSMKIFSFFFLFSFEFRCKYLLSRWVNENITSNHLLIQNCLLKYCVFNWLYLNKWPCRVDNGKFMLKSNLSDNFVKIYSWNNPIIDDGPRLKKMSCENKSVEYE